MFATFKKRSLQSFRHFGYRILTPTCILCQLPSKRDFDLCQQCERDFPSIFTACFACALPLTNAKTLCGQCLQHPTPITRSICLSTYEHPIDKLIHDLKFNQRLVNAQILGTLLCDKLKTCYQTLPELIIPVPLHSSRLRQRGFNQALEIARPISRTLQIKIDKVNCQRVRNTKQQSLLHGTERKQNVKNAFAVNNINAKHVAIIDDVITTGHTVIELSKALQQCGVERIDVWGVARTVTAI